MSDTPETDRIVRNAAIADHPPNRLAATLTVKCEKLERERDEARKEIEGWKNKWECAVEMAARAENECEEQAKLLAMSAEREADLLGKLDRIERAANNVILQWDSPSWKLTEPTAGVIYRLRNALGMGE